MLKIFLIFSLVLCAQMGYAGLPKGPYSNLTQVSLLNPITEEEFNISVDHFGDFFSDYARIHDSRLILEKYWKDPLINLYAENFNTIWYIHIYGGYARLPNLTNDALFLSLCHEFGHHIAGFPYKSAWSTVEGQADYFASQACLTELWKNETEVNRLYANQVDVNSKQRCIKAYENADQQNLCFRKATAALNLSQIFAKLLNTPDIDPTFTNFIPVTATKTEHVDSQCRFETFIRGALCSKPYNWKVIPGKIPGSVVPIPTEPTGTNALWAEKESAKSVCTAGVAAEADGARPNCWYYDRISLHPTEIGSDGT